VLFFTSTLNYLGYLMKKIFISIIASLVVISTAYAEEQTLQEYVQEACKQDKEKFCSRVTPGEGRLLACAAAHEDQLSGQCSHALYEAAEVLEKVVQTIKYIAYQCKDDIKAWCGNVKLGEGRILTCLDKNSSKLADSCQTALVQTVEKK